MLQVACDLCNHFDRLLGVSTGLDSTPARLAMQDVRKKLQDKERLERDAAAAVAQAAEAEQAEAQHWSREEREAQVRQPVTT